MHQLSEARHSAGLAQEQLALKCGLPASDIKELESGRMSPRITGQSEADAAELRNLLGFSNRGAVRNIVNALEDKGILIYVLNYENSDFSGLNGEAEGRPYIYTISMQILMKRAISRA